MARSTLLVAFLTGITCATPAVAMYKWVDDQGVTHYSETVPPEYSNKSRVELDKSGRVIKREEVLTPEQQRAQEAAAEKQRAEEEAAREQQRHDKALLNSYSNVREIDLARERNLQQIQTHINSISAQIKNTVGKLEALQQELDANVKAGKVIPRSLKQDIREQQTHQTELQQALAAAEAEKRAIEARFEADKVRYRELTGQ